MEYRHYRPEEVSQEVMRCISTVLELESGTHLDDDTRLNTHGLDVGHAADLLAEIEIAFRISIDGSERYVIFPLSGDQCLATYSGIYDCVLRTLRRLERLEE